MVGFETIYVKLKKPKNASILMAEEVKEYLANPEALYFLALVGAWDILEEQIPLSALTALNSSTFHPSEPFDEMDCDPIYKSLGFLVTCGHLPALKFALCQENRDMSDIWLAVFTYATGAFQLEILEWLMSVCPSNHHIRWGRLWFCSQSSGIERFGRAAVMRIGPSTENQPETNKLTSIHGEPGFGSVFTALMAGHDNVAILLLDHIPVVDISNRLIFDCISIGTVSFVKRLIESGLFPVEAAGNAVLKWIQGGITFGKRVNVEAVKLIVTEHPMVVCDIEDLSFPCCMIAAVRAEKFDLVEFFLQHPSFTHKCQHWPTVFEEVVFTVNAKNLRSILHLPQSRILLSPSGLEPNSHILETPIISHALQVRESFIPDLLKRVIVNDFTKILSHFLHRITPPTSTTCNNGDRAAPLKLFINHRNLDAFMDVGEYENVDGRRLFFTLLRNGRPADEEGRRRMERCAKLILKCPDVDPSVNENEALVDAFKRGAWEVYDVLLEDDRVKQKWGLY
ncbi:hypothetical protein BC829DRAFT_406620 [Chytridium lagenaria]|nr:hypothetical protein BC829DRAFT_406620 [Chytridium lagenaria]